jgi:putative peptidoglycan binding protein
MSDSTRSEGPGPPAERSSPDAPGRGRDGAPADDWQWDDIDWSEETRRPSPEPASVAHRAEEVRGGPPSDYEPAPGAHVAQIRRRRIAALAVLGVLFVVALVIPLVVFSGGGSSAEQTTPPTTAAQTTTAAQQTTTSEQPAVTTTPSTAPETAALQVTLPEGQTLSRGDRGSEVEDLQKALAELGFSPGQPDGIFGANTEAAVIDFQQSNGLTPDGVVGTDTVRLLNAALADKSASG